MTREIEKKNQSNKNLRTICEVHREIYDIIYDGNDEKLKDLINEAYGMAKKMDAKLRQYKYNYDDEWWEKEREEVLKEKLTKRNKR